MPRSVISRIVHVCGIPGCGKSTYCDWLARQKGFLHLDFDQLLKGNGPPLKLDLIGRFRDDPKEFISALVEIDGPEVLDWGFPISWLSTVRCFGENGVAIWWFDGNRIAAREAFVKRGTVSLGAFQVQMGSIEQNWPQIQEVIGDRVIQAVTEGPAFTTPEHVFDEMFGPNR